MNPVSSHVLFAHEAKDISLGNHDDCIQKFEIRLTKTELVEHLYVFIDFIQLPSSSALLLCSFNNFVTHSEIQEKMRIKAPDDVSGTYIHTVTISLTTSWSSSYSFSVQVFSDNVA